MPIGDILLKKAEMKIQEGLDAFAEGLVEDWDHPLITGITRGNWHPGVNSRTKLQDFYGYTDSDIFEAMEMGEILVDLGQAKETALDFNYSLGDTVSWTNSLDHIGELEQRRIFFDTIVENAKQKAQSAIKRGKK